MDTHTKHTQTNTDKVEKERFKKISSVIHGHGFNVQVAFWWNWLVLNMLDEVINTVQLSSLIIHKTGNNRT